MHLSFIFAALVELPAASVPVIINVVGRRWSLFFLFLFAGASCITYAIVPPGQILLSIDKNARYFI